MSLLDRAHESLIYGRRVRRLSEHLSGLIPDSCSVLDVGSGDGKLAWSLSKRRPDLRIEGVDVLPRKKTWLPIGRFDGKTLPYAASSFDAVMLIDVLHHAQEPLALLREAVRVSRNWLIVKDHVRKGLSSTLRLRLMDYVGNAGRGVALPYKYVSAKEWNEFQQALNLKLRVKKDTLGLYPGPVDYIFGSGLHFIALYESGDKLESEAQ
jgi:SAM-dependent methyltransferase